MSSKRLHKKNQISKRSSKKIAEVVKRELHKNIENKQATTYAINTRVSTNMASTIATGIYNVIPNLEQSFSANAGRVGQQVKPMSLNLKANFWLTPTLAQSAYPVYFDLYVFSIKAVNDATFDISSEMAKFFRPSTLQAGTDTIYVGAAQNWYQNINQDVIKMYHRQRFKMSPTIPSINQSIYVDNSAMLSQDVNISLTKHLKSSFKYTNSSDPKPNNQAIYATMVCTEGSATGATAPLVQFGACTFVSSLVYEDA